MTSLLLPQTAGPRLPEPRGPLSAGLADALVGGRTSSLRDMGEVDDPLGDDDLQLALYCCYELHYRGFAGISAEMEWEPEVVAFRSQLERQFLRGLRLRTDDWPTSNDAVAELITLATTARGPSLSAYLAGAGTVEELREFCIHRSAYQLKEADPHTWAIPRLAGPAKAAMVRIQADEYGGGHHEDVHATLFAGTMEALGLDPDYGAYLDRLPGPTLATVNLASLLGLHRRWRGALVGHLALFEMTSVVPMGRYAEALARAGVDLAGQRFYRVHVDADAEHQVVALEEMVTGLLADEPDLAADIVLGARALDVVERAFTAHLLGCWDAARSSLRPPG